MPVIEQRTAGGDSGMSTLLMFLIGAVIVVVAVLIILHGVLRIF